MKIEINEDVYDIAKRIKEIDEGYFVLYDTNKGKYEIHNKFQKSTYCLTVPFDGLDSRTIDLLLYSYIGNVDNILEEIDKNNINNEIKQHENVKNQSEYMVGEIYDFYSNSSKIFCNDSFSIVWR